MAAAEGSPLIGACHAATLGPAAWTGVLATLGTGFDARGPFLKPREPVRVPAALCSSSLDAIAFGAIFLDGSARVVHVTRAAADLIKGCLRIDRSGCLHSLGRTERPRFDRLLGAATGGIGPPGEAAMLLKGDGTRRPIHVELIPQRGPDAAPASPLPAEGGAILLLRDIFAPAIRPIAGLLQQLGLTPCEAGTATLIGRGASPREAARALLVSEATIRVHLRACFAKLGLDRQSELAVLVTRLDCAGTQAEAASSSDGTASAPSSPWDA